MTGWPAVLQLLLDQDGAGLSRSLQHPHGEAAAALSAQGSGAAAGLLLLASARSDTLLIKHLCAFGVCKRALEEAPSPSALSAVLVSAAQLSDRGSAQRDLRRVLLHLTWDSGRDSNGDTLREDDEDGDLYDEEGNPLEQYDEEVCTQN